MEAEPQDAASTWHMVRILDDHVVSRLGTSPHLYSLFSDQIIITDLGQGETVSAYSSSGWWTQVLHMSKVTVDNTAKSRWITLLNFALSIKLENLTKTL